VSKFLNVVEDLELFVVQSKSKEESNHAGF